MIAMKTELTDLTTTVKTMENRLQNQLDPKIVQYDEMLTAFETLSGSWKEQIQLHVLAADEKRKVADGKFAGLYAKASTSISEVQGRLAAADAQIAALAALTPSGGKGKGGNKWELSRPKDIEPSTFDGKEESWAKWKEEIEDYVDAVHEGLKHAMQTTQRISECVTKDLLETTGGLIRTEWSKSTELHTLMKRKSTTLSEAKMIVTCSEGNGYEAWRRLTIR